ncbi:MFS transporter [Nonomuraea sp. NPDC050643]|uniref:MFS transporter n=1 Tax=Nonomuraea sp. NPDC050643 TaxID=3155660 RepID=UPI0033D93E39
MGRERARGVVAALLLAAVTASLSQTIVIAVLPVLGLELAAPATGVTWVLTTFMLASAVATPIAGRLGDMFGYRRVLVACLGFFVAGTLVCGLAAETRSLGWMVAGRALQGVAGGVFPLAFGIVRSALAPGRMPGVIALLSAMFGIGGSAGMVLAGPVADAAGTGWLFWGTLPLATAALAATAALPRTVETSPGGSAAGPGAATRGGGRVDVGGAVLLSGALVALLLAISQGRAWGWGPAAVAGGCGAMALGGFVRVQLRAAAPLVDLRLMARRALVTTNLATLIVGAAMFGVITLIPRFVQTPPTAGYGFGASVTEAGLVMVPIALVMLIATPLAPRLAARYGARLPLQAGAALAAASFLLLAAFHDRLWHVYAAGLLVGAGYGLAFASIGNLVVEAVEPHQTGVATGVNTIVRTVGGAIGAQIAAALLATGTPAGPGATPAESGYTTALVVFAVLAVAALVAASAVPGRR